MTKIKPFGCIGSDSNMPRRAAAAVWTLVAVVVFLTCRQDPVPLPKSQPRTPKIPPSVRMRQGESPWFTLESDDKRHIIWFMTMSYAGSSFALSSVQRATDRSCASNYGDYVTAKGDYSLPIFPRAPEGPFWAGLGTSKVGNTPRWLPSNNVLVETYCQSVGRSTIVSTLDEFRDDCRTTYGRRAPHIDKVQQAQYPMEEVHKVVHLVRNPLMQIAEKFEKEYKYHDKSWQTQYPRSKKGLLKWCKDRDAKLEPSQYFYATEVRLIQNTTCAFEFLGYIHWHNRAFETVEEQQLPELVVHYEELANDTFDQTLRRISKFIEVPKVKLPSQRMEMEPQNYFDEDEQLRIKRLIHHMSIPKSWEYLNRYFIEEEESGQRKDLEQQPGVI